MPSHWHDPTAATQNSGNVLGDRPCVRLSESYMKQFSGVAAAEFTGGPPTERIPIHARYNPHCPVFHSPRETGSATIPAATPPKREHPRCGPGPRNNISTKQAFWSGSDLSNLLYGETLSHPPLCEVDCQTRDTGSDWVMEGHHADPYQTHPMHDKLEQWAREMGLLNDRDTPTAEGKKTSETDSHEFDNSSYWGQEKYSYHQRRRQRREHKQKDKLGSGDIITWSQTG